MFSNVNILSANTIVKNPSLIPLPQSVKWSNGAFLLNSCKAIIINDASLKKEALSLQQHISIKTGRHHDIVEKELKGPCIALKLGKVASVSGVEEAYQLIVNNQSITLTANTSHGIFNGLQNALSINSAWVLQFLPVRLQITRRTVGEDIWQMLAETIKRLLC